VLTRIWAVTIPFLILPLLWPCGLHSRGGDHAEDIDFWRSARNCGPNCLYLMLSGAGYNVSYKDLVAAVKVGPQGTTLPQMRDAALSLGCRLVIYKGTPEDLGTIRLPAILHLDPESGDVHGMGHFVVLSSYNGATREAQLFDGTTASPVAMGFEPLRRMWTGYLLCQGPESRVVPFLISMGGTMAVCTLLGLLRRRHRC
jgi:ABC-type bacteriocin/lantibiotic exporter with double-glycine peptidase domain